MTHPEDMPNAPTGLDPTSIAPELGILNEQAPMDDAAGGPQVSDAEDDHQADVTASGAE